MTNHHPKSPPVYGDPEDEELYGRERRARMVYDEISLFVSQQKKALVDMRQRAFEEWKGAEKRWLAYVPQQLEPEYEAKKVVYLPGKGDGSWLTD